MDTDLVLEQGDGRPCDTGEASKEFKRFVRRIGYPQLRFHDTRHGFATVSLAAGVDLKTISDQLGHATYSITADIYAKSTPQLRTEAAARLEALLGADGSAPINP